MILMNMKYNKAIMVGNAKEIAEYLGTDTIRVNGCYIQTIPYGDYALCKDYKDYLLKINILREKRYMIDRSKRND